MSTSSSRRDDSSSLRSVYAIVLFPCVVCWILYFYYAFAQSLRNPMPVTGQFVSANCVAVGASSNRLGGGSHMYLETVYEFVSRSADIATSPSKGSIKDRIVDRVLYEDGLEVCEPDQREALALRAPKRVWAGEDAMSARFRARLTVDQEYPSVLMLVVPTAFAALFFGVRRWISRAR